MWPCSMWDLNSLTEDKIHAPALEAQSLNHWTIREVPEGLKLEKGHAPLDLDFNDFRKSPVDIMHKTL